MESGGGTPRTPQPPERRPPFGVRLLGSGARSARAVAGATGVDRAVEAVTEEAIVRALESEAVERALVRVLQGPAVEEAMRGAIASPAVERALIDALDSELVDHVWERLLSSDEAQKLVERIADAPEVRSAIAAQGVGLLEDIGRQLQRATRRLDDGLERVVRAVLRRPQRTERTDRAGLVTRGVAIAADFGIVNAVFIGLSALAALVFGNGNGASSGAVVIGLGAWILLGIAYSTFFWSLAGQSPGMRILGIRIESHGSRRLGLRRAFRRAIGLLLAMLPLGLGLLGILTSERRRGLQDRIADTEVLYGAPSVRLIGGYSEP
jgi:uncharacterized RDD family membrane protein YckC